MSPGRDGSVGDRRTSHILVLGDSLAVSPSESENFVTELQRRVDDNGHPWILVNASVRGADTADGVGRIAARLTDDTKILILELGANDGLRGIPVATIEQNLTAIIERAHARGVRVVLCGMETPPTHGWDYSVAFHRMFPTLASRYSVRLVPFLLAGVALNTAMNGPDGIHPNAAGARQIADTVWPHLQSLIVQTPAASARGQ